MVSGPDPAPLPRELVAVCLTGTLRYSPRPAPAELAHDRRSCALHLLVQAFSMAKPPPLDSPRRIPGLVCDCSGASTGPETIPPSALLSVFVTPGGVIRRM